MSTPEAVVALINDMRARGVDVRQTPPPVLDAAHRPWFVSLLLGFAGWFAGILLLVFIAITLELKSSTAAFVIGTALMVGAWAMYFIDRKAVFFDQFALALSIAGQCAVAWSMLEDVKSATVISGVLLVMQLLVLGVMPNRTARTLAALFATVAWSCTAHFAIRYPNTADYFFGSAYEAERVGSGAATLAWLLTWLPLGALAYWMTTREQLWMATPLRDLARPALTGLLLGISVAGFASEPFGFMAFGEDALGARFGWWTLFPLLSIGLAMFAAYCAFRLRSFGVMGFAIFAALMHVSRFYYNFGTSLSMKSALMICVGAAMLGAGVLLGKRAEAQP